MPTAEKSAKSPSKHASAIDSLPRWQKIKAQGVPMNLTEIRCPYEDCQGVILVDVKKWAKARPEPTRSCTYCFRVSRIR